MRPTVAQDGRTTTNIEESALWKSVMCELYGTEWSIQLAAADEEAEADPTVAAAPSQPLEPGREPAEGAGLQLTPRQAVAEVSPGSGDPQTGAANGPGSGPATPVPSWSSRNPGTPGRLKTTNWTTLHSRARNSGTLPKPDHPTGKSLGEYG